MSKNTDVIMTDAEGNPEFHQYNQNQALMYQQQQQQQQMAKQQHMNLPRDESFIKLKRLDEINASIVKISQSLIQFFDELAKDKQPPSKQKVSKQMFENFTNHLRKVETDLLNEIQLLSLASTGHPHEGSVYGARKDYDLAKMRLNLVCSQFGSLRESVNLPLEQINDQSYEDDEDTDNKKEQ